MKKPNETLVNLLRMKNEIMINLTKKAPDLIKMEIKIHLPQMDVIAFLQKKGYEIEACHYISPALEEMLVSEPETQVNTFTATKAGEEQSQENQFLNVFEKEIKHFLEM